MMITLSALTSLLFAVSYRIQATSSAGRRAAELAEEREAPSMYNIAIAYLFTPVAVESLSKGAREAGKGQRLERHNQ